MHEHLYALVMAGGGGTRLWPLSRRTHPKQMLPLLGERTMFQVSVDRLLPLLPPEHIFVVTAREQVAPLAEQMPALPRENFVIEPMGRGTASCIGLSAVHLFHRDPEAVMCVVTADHAIQRETIFRSVLVAGQAIAEQDYLVTLGIAPLFPATGYGYIRRGEKLGQWDVFNYFKVEQFTEKPDEETAIRFLQEGVYSWNSGMFIWRADRILQEIRRWMPDLYATLETLGAVLDTPAYETKLQALWPLLHKETIDYGIMERADKVAVIPVDLGWSDIGAWNSVMEFHERDEHGNVLRGNVMDVATLDTMVLANAGRLVATIGVQDLIVVDTPDALLITRRDLSQHVREVVEQLKADGKDELL
ncbi:MAG: mannose-1-phosphate guanylyltransferase [Anaerolineae bacterium]|nr:mannose-1-phosphate guanylyltransferase [Anaerolineae bacterium]